MYFYFPKFQKQSEDTIAGVSHIHLHLHCHCPNWVLHDIFPGCLKYPPLLFSIIPVIHSCKFKTHVASRVTLSKVGANQVYMSLKSHIISIMWKIICTSSGLWFDSYNFPQTPKRPSLIHSWFYRTKNCICYYLTTACIFPASVFLSTLGSPSF